MLNPQYRYIGLDFETTGLDVSKDEPIQIGIVEMDCNFQIVSKYQSLIKPHKDISELKSIVGFITGLSISDLEKSPDISDITDEVLKYSGNNVVIIGHNVGFDIGFLNKYFPDFQYMQAIDTFQYMQNFVHYAQSYALDVLIGYCKNDKFFQEIESDLKVFFDGGDNFHDALFDSENSLGLFVYTIKYIERLIERYPVTKYFVSKHSVLSKIFNILDCDYKNIKLDSLTKILAANTSFKETENAIDLSKIKKNEKYFVGNLDLKKLIESLLFNKNIILSCSNNPKMDIVKNILNDMGIKNIGFAKEEQIINADNFNRFVNKAELSDEEAMFVLKYISHLYRGYGILDLNNKSDFQIYTFIKDQKNFVRYPVVLTSHVGLFSLLEKNKELYSDYKICFLDIEYWYKNYNFYMSKNCDLYYMLNYIDMLIYKYKVSNQLGNSVDSAIEALNNFVSFFQIFIGEIFIETKNIFKNTNQGYIQSKPIIDNPDFFKTNSMLNQFDYYKSVMSVELEKIEFETLWNQIDNMFKIFESVVNINQRTYNQSDFYFVYSDQSKFTNRTEFLDFFGKIETYFLSNHDTKIQHIDKDIVWKDKVDIMEIGKIDNLVQWINDNKSTCKNIFIASTKKDESKAIFDALLAQKLDKEYMILIENITGGFGKNIFKANASKNKIIIGGYNFILSMYANKVHIDKVLLFNIKGGQEKYILDDIRRYA